MDINIRCDCGNNSFVPNFETVNLGQPVVWHNRDSVEHNIKAQDGTFAHDTIPPGGKSNPITPPFGTHSYTCTAHPGMDGTLVVKPGDAGIASLRD